VDEECVLVEKSTSAVKERNKRRDAEHIKKMPSAEEEGEMEAPEEEEEAPEEVPEEDDEPYEVAPLVAMMEMVALRRRMAGSEMTVWVKSVLAKLAELGVENLRD
jgi:hypothetical protein